MGNENGTWIMYGVDKDDPYCIHTVEQLIEYIDEIGFIPLFKNEIPGFSVEERTAADYWWTEETVTILMPSGTTKKPVCARKRLWISLKMEKNTIPTR